MTRRLVQILLASGLILLAAATWQKEALPPQQVLSPDLLKEPEQGKIGQAAFDTRVNGVTYSIQPLYTYHLYGLVVSMHDSKTWWDYIHREWNDHLNVMDLCVVWGNNVSSGAYKGIDYSSGQFVCYVNPKSIEAFQAFDQHALSNNHLLTDNPDIARAIRKVRIGDQIRFRGYLAEYSHNHGQPFKRGTSIVRTDTGNGVCETIFIEDFEILKPGGGPWRILVWVAAFMLVVGVIAWFRLPIDPGIRTALDPEKFRNKK